MKEEPEWTPRARRPALLRTRQGPRPQARSLQRHRRAAPDRWISSRDTKGNINLAPYSFFNGFCYHPPIIGFASTSWKDSVQNIQETGEFVWNLATKDLAQQMNATAAHVAHDVSEFKIAGLTAVPGKLVNVPRVAESPVAFECKVTQIIQLQGDNGEKAQAWLTLGEVVAVHIDKAMIKDGVYQTALARPIVRAGRKRRLFRDQAGKHVRDDPAGLSFLLARPALRGVETSEARS